MSNVVNFPAKAHVDNGLGGCPICGGNDGWLNVNRDEWAVCHGHSTKWLIGSNLFSDWQAETEVDWLRNFYKLATYREVEPLLPPSGGAA
jgi:hypothetical protein